MTWTERTPSQSIAGFMIAGYGAEAGEAGGDVVFLAYRDQVMAVGEEQGHPGGFDHVHGLSVCT